MKLMEDRPQHGDYVEIAGEWFRVEARPYIIGYLKYTAVSATGALKYDMGIMPAICRLKRPNKDEYRLDEIERRLRDVERLAALKPEPWWKFWS